MNKAELLRLARPWLKRKGVRVWAVYNPRGCDFNGREYARTRMRDLEKPERPAMCPDCKLKFQVHRRAFREFEKQESHWRSRAMSHRYRLYTVRQTGLGTMMTAVAEGDSWEIVAQEANLI